MIDKNKDFSNDVMYVPNTKYAIEQDINVDGVHCVFAVDKEADDGMYYFVGNIVYNGLYTSCTVSFVSNDYAEAMMNWASNLKVAFESLMNITKQITAEIGRKPQTITKESVDLNVKDYENKVCVVNANSIVRGSDNEINQLVFITHGNGTNPYARGSACYAEEIYSGKSVRWERSDILGVLKKDCIPDWAKAKLNDLQKEFGCGIVALKEVEDNV